jgi:hypothetical protein
VKRGQQVQVAYELVLVWYLHQRVQREGRSRIVCSAGCHEKVNELKIVELASRYIIVKFPHALPWTITDTTQQPSISE